MGRDVRGRDEFRSYMRMVQAAFPDFHNEVKSIIHSGHNIAVRLEYTGTHEGSLLGIAPTHRRITYPGIAIFEERDGNLLSGFVVGDRLTLLQQILGDSFWTNPATS
jgi:predicted ester cyclase